MRILLSHRFFWPDSPPYASMLRAIGAHLAANGNDVTVLSTQPSYRPEASLPKQPSVEVVDGMKVRRAALIPETKKDILIRASNAVLYSLRVFLHVLTSRRYDVVVVSTFPPILLGFLTSLACRLRSSCFVYHCMDLHPEVSIVGKTGSKGLWFSLLEKVDHWTCRHAAVVIVLSEDMRNTLLARAKAGNKAIPIRIVRNFALPEFDSEEPDDAPPGEFDAEDVPGGGRACFRVVFAGNLGRFQSLDTVVKAAAMLSDLTNLQIVFMGDGVMLDELKALGGRLGCANVTFLPFQKPSVAKRLVAKADFGLVTLRQGMYKVAYPSKTMTYLSVGCPIIAMVEPESEIAKTVVSERLGYAVPDATAAELSRVIREAFEQRRYWQGERDRLERYADKHSSAAASFRQWDELLDAIK